MRGPQTSHFPSTTPGVPRPLRKLAPKPGGAGLRVFCPAKVNLYLRVLGRRDDGYHDLLSIMQPLSLADELTVSPTPPGIFLDCDQPGIPRGPGNLVWQAALGFQRVTGRRVGAHFGLKKRIPAAAGLGGGSSDAAGALLALNTLAGEPLKAEALHNLAGELGADVPFFLGLGPAVARGIGTELSPVELPAYWYLLLNPGVRVSTRWVYESLDLKALKGYKILGEGDWDPEQPGTWVHNDLESVTLKRYPQLADLLETLGRLGAQARGMSGSGPTLFGLFPTLEAARQAGQKLRGTFEGWMALARGLTGQEADAVWGEQAWMV
ncbi:MAG: 4-(cytidine 5'-diphospho)-2-C-methyl-D-erythritol kinase [Deltaproteobacteria bacterium]|nr:4-(cytidine 5'-diphospho)-2-C-methyl-D-erythritol kinase [Deltaproteobacteria bacterium]MBI4796241.1 4-(cytidine 5'-diphospho)-2-C-methyl-D-erythritol kinase [Deltaproteobacteria bacterium]